MTIDPPSRPGFSAGDFAPWFTAPILAGPHDFAIEKCGGRHVLMLFLGSAADAESATALRLAEAHHALFDDLHASFFGVTADPDDVPSGRVAYRHPGVHIILDPDRRVSRRYGAAGADDGGYRPHWLLIGPGLRVVAQYPPADGARAIDALARAMAAPPADVGAPVLTVPDVIEPDFRRRLIDLYERHGGAESGFMRQVGGKTVPVHDHGKKRRADHVIEDEAIRAALRDRLVRRLLPAIRRAYCFNPTRIERYIVACYDGATGGHFAAHRDNTTTATAHRRFAVTINLNDDYAGGDLRFPEFGPRTYRAPAGGAIVFGCSLLHEATRVTAGRRYATLPFLYDDAAAAIRDANRGTLEAEPQAAA